MLIIFHLSSTINYENNNNNNKINEVPDVHNQRPCPSDQSGRWGKPGKNKWSVNLSHGIRNYDNKKKSTWTFDDF